MNEYKEELIMKIDKKMKRICENTHPVSSVCIGDNSEIKKSWCVIGDNIDPNKKLPPRCIVIVIKDVTIVIGEKVLGKKNSITKTIRERVLQDVFQRASHKK